MDGHCSFATVSTLEAYVVFEIFAYDFKNLEIFFRKILALLRLLRLWLAEVLDLVLELSY